MDSRRSPQRVGDAHPADQPANFQRCSWSAAAVPRFPAQGVGRIYQQTFIDTFAKLYQSSIDASVVQKPSWMMNPGQLEAVSWMYASPRTLPRDIRHRTPPPGAVVATSFQNNPLELRPMALQRPNL
jgi:hypothetical protein